MAFFSLSINVVGILLVFTGSKMILLTTIGVQNKIFLKVHIVTTTLTIYCASQRQRRNWVVLRGGGEGILIGRMI